MVDELVLRKRYVKTLFLWFGGLAVIVFSCLIAAFTKPELALVSIIGFVLIGLGRQDDYDNYRNYVREKESALIDKINSESNPPVEKISDYQEMNGQNQNIYKQ